MSVQSEHSLKYSYFPRMQSVSACLPSPCTVVMRCPSRKRSTLERYEEGPLSTTTSFSTLNTHGPMWPKQISIKQHKVCGSSVFVSGTQPQKNAGTVVKIYDIHNIVIFIESTLYKWKINKQIYLLTWSRTITIYVRCKWLYDRFQKN